MKSAVETKHLPGPEVTAAFEEFMTAFEAFKDANDQRLGELERRGGDVVTTDKVERINAALDTQKALIDELVLKARRPALGGAGDLVERSRGPRAQGGLRVSTSAPARRPG